MRLYVLFKYIYESTKKLGPTCIVCVNTNATQEIVTVLKSLAAIELVSQEDVDFYSDRQTVQVIEAFTELPSGERIPVAADAVRVVDEERSEGAAMFTSLKTQVVIFPKISVGARAHSTVVRKTHTPLFPAEAKITRIPTGASFDEAGLFYQSTY